jgi:hypothetical protein
VVFSRGLAGRGALANCGIEGGRVGRGWSLARLAECGALANCGIEGGRVGRGWSLARLAECGALVNCGHRGRAGRAGERVAFFVTEAERSTRLQAPAGAGFRALARYSSCARKSRQFDTWRAPRRGRGLQDGASLSTFCSMWRKTRQACGCTSDRGTYWAHTAQKVPRTITHATAPPPRGPGHSLDAAVRVRLRDRCAALLPRGPLGPLPRRRCSLSRAGLRGDRVSWFPLLVWRGRD